jgi:hypothetical protein
MIRLVAVLPLTIAATGTAAIAYSEFMDGRPIAATCAALAVVALLGIIGGLTLQAAQLRSVCSLIARLQRQASRDSLARTVSSLPPRKRAALELLLDRETPPGGRLH